MPEEQQNPQPASPGEGPGLVAEVPQAQPAAGNGPDSLNMPNLGQAVAPQTGGRDYRASYEGLNKWVTKEFNELRDTVDRMAHVILAQQPQAAPESEPAPAPDPAPKAPAPAKEGPNALDLALERKKAEQYRDLLLEEYEKATGLPVTSFRQHVKAVAPSIGENGSLDDGAQRALIEDLVSTLKGVRGEAQEQVLKGHMPGSAPGGPVADSADKLYEEFLDVMAVYGSEEFEKLDPAKQSQMEDRYFELLQDPAVQERHEGDLQPAMGYEDMASEVRALRREVERLKGGRPANMA